MKPFKQSQYQYNKKTIFYFILLFFLFYPTQKVYVIDKVQFTTTRRINHRTECYPSNQQPQVFLARLIIADIRSIKSPYSISPKCRNNQIVLFLTKNH